jgi:chromosome segregation ATPase
MVSSNTYRLPGSGTGHIMSVEVHASGDSNSGSIAPSPGGTARSEQAGRRDAVPHDDTSRAGAGPAAGEGELQAVVAAASGQLSQDLATVGSQMSRIEAGHRALMEELRRIAEQADERAQRQFGSLQKQADEARKQILSARDDLEVVRCSFFEELQVMRGQWQSAQQQLDLTEQRSKESEQQLRLADARLQTTEDKHDTVEQRLQHAERKSLEGEESWQRSDELLQTTRNQLQSLEQQLQATVHQLRQFQQQLTHAETRIETQLTDGETRIKNQLTDADTRIRNQLADADSRIKGYGTQIADIKRQFDEQGLRRENVEISIGELARDMGEVKEQLPKLAADEDRIANLQALLKANRRRQRTAVMASVLSLLTVVYLLLGKPGWPAIAQSLSAWVPGLTF